MGASDESLVNAAVLGDRDAFEAFILRNGPAILRYAQNMLSDHQVAGDIVREAFAAAWATLDRVGRDVPPRMWLYALTTCEITTYRSGRGNDNGPRTGVHGSGAVRISLSAALMELSQRQRAAWLLHAVEGVSLAHVGWILGCTCDTARAHFARATVALRSELTASSDVGGT